MFRLDNLLCYMIVNFDEIELKSPDYGGGNVYYYQGQPFTGTIVEYKNNVLIGEISVIEGHTQGRVALYYDNGQIEQEYFKKYNQMYGIYKRWDENGNLVKEINYGPEP